MKKIILIIFSILILVSCNNGDNPTTNESEVTSESSNIIYEGSLIDSSLSENDNNIPGLLYTLPEYEWNEEELSNTTHTYRRGGDYNTGLYFSYYYMAGQSELPIDVDNAFATRITTIQKNENLSSINIEESAFNEYPCIYITTTYDYEPSDDSRTYSHFNQYILCFIANDGLYIVQLATTDDLRLHMDEFNEIVESIVIVPI